MASRSYHHGHIIKEARERQRMTQAKLAEQWPKKDGDEGVNIRYVQDIEAGRKHITDQVILRKLSELLAIPLWKFGLSEYDPFNPHTLPGQGERLHNETLDVVESLLHMTLSMRSVAPLPEVASNAQRLHAIFDHFLTYLPPPTRLEQRFLRLYAQEQSLTGLMYYEHKQYRQAIETFEQMYLTAKQLDNPALLVHALQKLAVEYNRAGRISEAINCMEQARDISFRSSKHVAVFANAYLAHIYADAGDALRFERAIDTALSLVGPLKDSYGDGTDYIHQRVSGILSIHGRGYVRVNKPEKLFSMQDEIRQQIGSDNNQWMRYRLALYRARAYLMQGEIEASINAARDLFRDVRDWQSPHRTAQAQEFVLELEKADYGDVKAVQEFREEISSRG